MKACELLAQLEVQGVALSVNDDKLHFNAPEHVMTDALLQMLREHKDELLELLRTEAEGAMRRAPLVTPATPLVDVKEPVHIHSKLLDTDFWLCPTKRQAEALQAEGKVTYTFDECRKLGAMKQADPDGFAGKLRHLHTVKAVFGATVRRVERQETAHEKAPVG
jgi:hypothetical protein